MFKRGMMFFLCILLCVTLCNTNEITHAENNLLGVYTITVYNPQGDLYSGEVGVLLDEGSSTFSTKGRAINGVLTFELLGEDSIQKMYVYPIDAPYANSQWLEVNNVNGISPGRDLGRIDFQEPTVSGQVVFADTVEEYVSIEMKFRKESVGYDRIYYRYIGSDMKFYAAPFSDDVISSIEFQATVDGVKCEKVSLSNNTYDNEITLTKPADHTVKVLTASGSPYNGGATLTFVSDSASKNEYVNVVDGITGFNISAYAFGEWKYIFFSSDNYDEPNTGLVSLEGYDSTSPSHDFGEVKFKEATLSGRIVKDEQPQNYQQVEMKQALLSGKEMTIYHFSRDGYFAMAPFEDNNTNDVEVTVSSEPKVTKVFAYNTTNIVIDKDEPQDIGFRLSVVDSQDRNYDGELIVFSDNGSLKKCTAVNGEVQVDLDSTQFGTSIYLLALEGDHGYSSQHSIKGLDLFSYPDIGEVKLYETTMRGKIYLNGQTLLNHSFVFQYDNGDSLNGYTDENGNYKFNPISDYQPSSMYVRLTSNQKDYESDFFDVKSDHDVAFNDKTVTSARMVVKTPDNELFTGELELTYFSDQELHRVRKNINEGSLSFEIGTDKSYTGVMIAPTDGNYANSKMVILPDSIGASIDLGGVSFQEPSHIGVMELFGYNPTGLVTVEYLSDGVSFITNTRSDSKFYIAPLTSNTSKKVKLSAVGDGVPYEARLYPFDANEIEMKTSDNEVEKLMVRTSEDNLEGMLQLNGSGTVFYLKENSTVTLDFEAYDENGVEIPIPDSEFVLTDRTDYNNPQVIGNHVITAPTIISGDKASGYYNFSYGNESSSMEVCSYRGSLGYLDMVKPDQTPYEGGGDFSSTRIKASGSNGSGGFHNPIGGRIPFIFPETMEELEAFLYIFYPDNRFDEVIYANTEVVDFKQGHTKDDNNVYYFGQVQIQEPSFTGTVITSNMAPWDRGRVRLYKKRSVSDTYDFSYEYVPMKDNKFYLASFGELIDETVKLDFVEGPSGEKDLTDQMLDLSSTSSQVFKSESSIVLPMVSIIDFKNHYDVKTEGIINLEGIIESEVVIEKVSYAVMGWYGEDVYGEYNGVYKTIENDTVTFDLSNMSVDTLSEALDYKGKGYYSVNVWIKERNASARKVASFSIKKDQEIIFEDSNLEAAVRRRLQNESDPIYESDLEGVVRLNVKFDEYIESLSGIQYLKNLRYLDLPNLQVDDQEDFNKNFAYITQLKNLEELGMYGSNLENMDWIVGFENLTRLYVANNKIDDVNAISKLTSLEYLDISYNDIEDIDPLNNLILLTELNIEANPIKDYTAIVSLYENLYDYNEDFVIPDIAHDTKFEGKKMISNDDVCRIKLNDDISNEEVRKHLIVGMFDEDSQTIVAFLEPDFEVNGRTIIINPPNGGYEKGVYVLYLNQNLTSSSDKRIRKPIKHVFEVE